MDFLGLDKPIDWRDPLVKLQNEIVTDLEKARHAPDTEQQLNAMLDVVAQQLTLHQMVISAMFGVPYRLFAQTVNDGLKAQGLPPLFDVPNEPPA